MQVVASLPFGAGIWRYMEEQKKRRKTKWSFHSFAVGDTKTMLRHELPNFRSALSVWNHTKGNERIEYEYENTPTKVTVKRVPCKAPASPAD